MATFTLDELKSTVQKKYAPTVVKNGKDEYVLPNMFQLDSARRKKVLEKVDALEELEGTEAQLEATGEILSLLVDDDRGEELLALLGDNPALLMELFREWMEVSEVGEVERS